MRKSLKLGESNIWLAKASIENLNKIVEAIPLETAKKYLNFVLPLLSTYLRVYDTSFLSLQNEEKLAQENHNITMRESRFTWNLVTSETLKFLGKIGGLSHMIIPSNYRDQFVDK